ncbi:MAG: hypothetical protein A3H32_02795 [Betaproteobacteria bacterium RIFCSPLOWO2_02_FULL_63_19]|nr:MAG: hypothetical protein A3H32_02795 [Betaproteobacteria bacterium RIFCSPLOWO2_02_FULL_63_19]
MRPPVIRKQASDFRVPPNLRDADADRIRFSWDSVRRELGGLPGGGLNIAYEAVDRHAEGALAQRTALRCQGSRPDPAMSRQGRLQVRPNKRGRS